MRADSHPPPLLRRPRLPLTAPVSSLLLQPEPRQRVFLPRPEPPPRAAPRLPAAVHRRAACARPPRDDVLRLRIAPGPATSPRALQLPRRAVRVRLGPQPP